MADDFGGKQHTTKGEEKYEHELCTYSYVHHLLPAHHHDAAMSKQNFQLPKRNYEYREKIVRQSSEMT